ncbi:DinB family protein [Congregibacter brevis]|uniref:DinB family protein n=1 Tax=Congregibacter brevis TaxID=3081201 RepID=A0ABZ0IF45_9GAMM|nr:DinB family protein [Congregibacter sp. IMCC45268]
MIDRDLFPDAYAFALQQINHIVIVEELFISRLGSSSAPHESTNTAVIPNFEELEGRLSESADWFESYVDRMENGSEKVAFVFADGKRGMLSIDEILFHIVNHSSYHRGNIARALDLASVPHPIDGYGIYIHEKEPARRKT